MADTESKPQIKVEDRRHWARADRGEEEAEESGVPSTHPTVVDEYRRRAEEAEARLQEYIAAFKQAQSDQEQFRLRLERDVDRRVELRFGGLVGELLDCLDDLDLALSHAGAIPEAEPLTKGVELARTRFLAALERAGVERVDPADDEFDPNVSEAVRVDPVADDGRDGRVTETLRPGYRLGDHVIRPARVAVAMIRKDET